LNSGERVRLVCIDTPEKGESYSNEATQYTESLVLGKEVELKKDVSDKDIYGRLLRYVYVDGKWVNYYLVMNGYARVYRYPPDTTLCDELEEAEQYAKSKNLGIWEMQKEQKIEDTTEASTSSYVCSYNYYNVEISQRIHKPKKSMKNVVVHLETFID